MTVLPRRGLPILWFEWFVVCARSRTRHERRVTSPCKKKKKRSQRFGERRARAARWTWGGERAG